MARISRSRVKLSNGLSLEYGSIGVPAAPRIVFAPGPTDSWRSYAPVLEALPADVAAIAFSPRGHGDSDKPLTGYRVSDFAGDIALLLDVTGAGRVVIAGHSGSCLAVRRVALDHPDRVAGLVLEAAPTSLRADALLAEFVDSVVNGLEDPIDPAFARAFLIDTASPGIPESAIAELTEDLLKIPARVWKEMFTDLNEYDDVADLARIVAPVLLVWGDGDTLVGRAMQDALVASITNVELRIHAGAGHTPRWDDPARFAAETATFVRSCFEG